MNKRMIFYTVGRLLRAEALLLILPMAVSLIYREKCTVAFILTAALAAILGQFLMLASRPKDKTIYAKEGFVIVSFSWLAFSAVGALPFVLSREIPDFVDAFFETVSGFTTTGASILRNVEALSHGILFWRSFTHWVGGMGILVLVVALFSGFSDHPYPARRNARSHHGQIRSETQRHRQDLIPDLSCHDGGAGHTAAVRRDAAV